MPIYEYQCERCGTVTDIKHGFKETNERACPSCAGSLKRLFNPASIVFKGSGFYATDSRKPAPSAEKADGTKSEPAAKSEPASGGAPAAKNDAPKSGSDAAKSGSDAAA